jgi:hypothetical protein
VNYPEATLEVNIREKKIVSCPIIVTLAIQQLYQKMLCNNLEVTIDISKLAK